MNILHIEQKKLQKRFALLAAQYTNAKAYRGVPYQSAPKKVVHGEFVYRGHSYTA